MLTLFHAPKSRSTRMIWLLEELGADYDIRYVTISYLDGHGAGPDPANMHPDKKVPALLHDGVVVSESTALAIYLCDLLPAAGLAPTVGDPARGPFLTWLVWSDTELGPAMFARMVGGTAAANPQASFDGVVRRLDEALARGPYLLGDRFSAVDIMVGLGLRFFRAALGENPAIDAYLERITSRPLFARTLALDEPVTGAAA